MDGCDGIWYDALATMPSRWDREKSSDAGVYILAKLRTVRNRRYR